MRGSTAISNWWIDIDSTSFRLISLADNPLVTWGVTG